MIAEGMCPHCHIIIPASWVAKHVEDEHPIVDGRHLVDPGDIMVWNCPYPDCRHLGPTYSEGHAQQREHMRDAHGMEMHELWMGGTNYTPWAKQDWARV